MEILWHIMTAIFEHNLLWGGGDGRVRVNYIVRLYVFVRHISTIVMCAYSNIKKNVLLNNKNRDKQ